MSGSINHVSLFHKKTTMEEINDKIQGNLDSLVNVFVFQYISNPLNPCFFFDHFHSKEMFLPKP